MNELTEKQKMLSGQWYFPSNKLLQQERAKAKKFCQQFNQHDLDDRKGSRKFLQQLLGQYQGAWIEPDFYCDYGYNIFLGKNFYANHGLVILDTAPVYIGDNVMIGPKVVISTASHPLQAEARCKGLEIALSITIGNNVWIGAGATILEGVTIGDNAVIGAGSIVNKDVPADTVVAGVPAKFLKQVNEEKSNG